MRRLDSPDVMLVTANVLWSLNYATTKFALGAWQPLAFSQLGSRSPALLSCSIVLRPRGQPADRPADCRLVVAAARHRHLAEPGLFNYACTRPPPANVALILASAPAFAALFAVRVGHEHVRRGHWLGLLVSLAGVTLVVEGGGRVAGGSLLGDLLAVGAAVTWAAYSVMLRPLFGRYSASRLSALMIAIGARHAAPAVAAPGARPGLRGAWRRPLGGLGLLGHLPAAGHQPALLPRLRRIGAARATLYMYLQPFLAVVFAAVLLGEKVAVIQLAGGLVIIGGVALGRRGPRPRGVEVQPADAG